MRRRALSAVFLFIICPVAADFAHALDLNKHIKEVKISGNQRANSNTVLFYIHSKAGESYSVKKTREDIRRIYDLGYFDDITLDISEEADGLILTYRLKEKPFVKSVQLEGVKEIPKKDMELFIKLKKGVFFQKHLIKKDIKLIKKKYRKKGFYFTDVTPIIKESGNNQIEVAYHVDEKEKIKISRVEFRGNNHFKGYELEGDIETKAAGFWSFFAESGNFDREILKTDLLRLESKYRDDGFMRATLEEPRVEVDKEKGMILVSFVVHEGDQYFVRNITADDDMVHTAEEILGRITLKKGEPFNQSLFRSNLFTVTEMYSDKGYAYANPIPKIDIDEDNKEVDIHIRVDPGHRVYIGKINVVGNEKTSGDVIRREFRLHEGAMFNGSKMRRTRERIINLGFFNELNIEQKSGAQPELMDLDVHVAEKETGNVRAGFGYSSFEKFMVQAEVSESNFLGQGYKLSVGVESSGLRDNYHVNFTNPRFMDRDILLGFKAYSRVSNFTSYDLWSTGGGVNVGRGISEYTSVSLGYEYETVKVAVGSIVDPNSFLGRQGGTWSTSSIKPVIVKDRRNNFMNPSKGYKLKADTKIAGGPLGGDRNFYKITAEGSKYYSLPLGLVFMARSQARYATGYDGKELPFFEHYYIGGIGSLRGFSYLDVGPLDDNGDVIGGDSSLLFNFELSYDFSKALKLLIFYDRGQVYGADGDLSKTTKNRYDIADMRHSIGFGIRFLTPAMPISMAWGFKLDQKPGESSMEFHFTLGSFF
ncbi:MAG: outer membrane protein assembly factor BamA [Nitrospinota bacterium]